MGFIVTAGNADGNGTTEAGGGVHIRSGNPTLRNCMFKKNSAGFCGGGLYNVGTGSSPTLIGCTFLENRVTSQPGGGFVGGGGMCDDSFQSEPRLVRCSFRNNVSDGYGGGMLNCHGSTPTLVECTPDWTLPDRCSCGAWHSPDYSRLL